jgi:hypothetical protein
VQADWAHFPDVIVGGEARSLVAFKMVLSHSRKDAIVRGLRYPGWQVERPNGYGAGLARRAGVLRD